MPCDGLRGKRHLDEVVFHRDVAHEPGVYIFYRTFNGPERYVGRTDTSLFNRIRGRNYRYYKYKHCDSDIEAYDWECKYWHDFQDTIDNSFINGGNHPAKPVDTNIYCTECGK
jgi:hypothetical protein